MKKVLLIALIVCMLLLLAACPSGNPSSEPNDDGQDSNNEQTDGGDEVNSMKIVIGNVEFTATLYDTEAAQAFAELLPLTLNMSELNGNEKYKYLSTTLSTKTESVGTINAGDIMLYGNNCIVLFYKSFSTPYSYTRIGKINDVTGLQKAVGSGSVVVSFQK